MESGRPPADADLMEPALVHCSACGREWHSATMVEGLRVVGSCPRCGGELAFAEPVDGARPAQPPAGPDPQTAPHRVLGMPRR